jgi:hypothetical protein
LLQQDTSIIWSGILPVDVRLRNKFLHFSVLRRFQHRTVGDRAAVIDSDVVQKLPNLFGFEFGGVGCVAWPAD